MNLTEYLEASKSNPSMAGYNAGQAFYSLEGRKATCTVSFGGYRWNIVRHIETGMIVAAIPTSRSADRGSIYRTYFRDFDHGYHCFSGKLSMSASLLADYLADSPTDEELMTAIGKATGRCACCGCELTDPVSISRGIGPECIKKIWGRAVTKRVAAKRLAEVA